MESDTVFAMAVAGVIVVQVGVVVLVVGVRVAVLLLRSDDCEYQ